ncbi:hypothetical protein AVEN_194553-1 [Araneus ventricosus]|uniref:Uncharacterized protein n=1 Tax=Araneus ventricosus TaxID=182803 RepID=A0A4Y2A6F5_ARAVE|nr:hypothetical protein AVEN_194553-1 [Araneus ventricosus]
MSTTPAGGRYTLDIRFDVLLDSVHIHERSSVESSSNLEPSDLEAESLPQILCDFEYCYKHEKSLPINKHEGYFGTNLVILNRGQMTRTSESTSLFRTSASHHREDVSSTSSSHTRRIFTGIGFRTCKPSTPQPRHNQEAMEESE